MSFLNAPWVETTLLAAMLGMVRPGAALLAAPLFGAASVPLQLRLVLALALAIPAMASGHVAVPDPATSLATLGVTVAGEVLIGLAMGLVVQMAFVAATMAGEVIGNAMGLGFAAMIDPASNQHSPALGQLLMLLATFLFFASNGHLLFVRAIIESYAAVPVGAASADATLLRTVIDFGSVMFHAGLAIWLPLGFATILIQLVMAMLARSAPQLNLFAVGLPATLLAGIVMLAIGLPAIADGIGHALATGLAEAARIGSGR